MIEINDMAPDFTLPRDGGAPVSLSDLRGRAVVLFFYPRDDTPGCTKESIGFSEQLDAFSEAGAQVLGISADSVASHEKFIAKHGLTMPLLADESAEVCRAYGVWKEKKMYGRSFMGIERSTFLIDAQGRVQAAWRKVRVPGHVEAVLSAVRAM
ncbi:peroxiredoxin [Sedimentitalea sp. HM32M-2]|uniref:peroxiredoxin n=1 Tax=Sedimentitalea sp. HM32M-2 TaxID=3351566 RepID=UPI003624B752